MKKSAKVADSYHKPVLLHEAVDWLAVQPDRWYVDATVGGGGHAAEILKRGGRVLGIDQDEEALAAAKEHLSQVCPDAPWQLRKGNFSHLASLVDAARVELIGGVLFDLGISSWQIGGHGRGFSFQKDEELDMRMDRKSQQVTAKDLVAALSVKELYELFTKYGGEQLAQPIAHHLVRTRRHQPIVNTGQLRKVVAQVYRRFGRRKKRLDPATKVFLALRMAVNSELENLQRGLIEAWQVLERSGRLIVISFHEGEDRIVKNQFRQWQDQGKGRILTPKPIVPQRKEIAANPRARSAKLRACEKR